MRILINKKLILESAELLEEWGRPVTDPAHKSQQGSAEFRSKILAHKVNLRNFRNSADSRIQKITLPPEGDKHLNDIKPAFSLPGTTKPVQIEDPTYGQHNAFWNNKKDVIKDKLAEVRNTNAVGDGTHDQYTNLLKSNKAIRDDHNARKVPAKIFGGEHATSYGIKHA
jgi:hypothetical protein